MLQRWSDSQVILSPVEKGHATRLAKKAHQGGPAHLLVTHVRSAAVARKIIQSAGSER